MWLVLCQLTRFSTQNILISVSFWLSIFLSWYWKKKSIQWMKMNSYFWCCQRSINYYKSCTVSLDLNLHLTVEQCKELYKSLVTVTPYLSISIEIPIHYGVQNQSQKLTCRKSLVASLYKFFYNSCAISTLCTCTSNPEQVQVQFQGIVGIKARAISGPVWVRHQF